eukprot:gene10356-1875_t
MSSLWCSGMADSFIRDYSSTWPAAKANSVALKNGMEKLISTLDAQASFSNKLTKTYADLSHKHTLSSDFAHCEPMMAMSDALKRWLGDTSTVTSEFVKSMEGNVHSWRKEKAIMEASMKVYSNEVAKLEKEKGSIVSSNRKLKQKYFQASEQAERQQTHVETHSAQANADFGQLVKMSQKSEQLRAQSKKFEAEYFKESSKACQFNTMYNSRMGVLSEQTCSVDKEMVQSTRKQLAQVVEHVRAYADALSSSVDVLEQVVQAVDASHMPAMKHNGLIDMVKEVYRWQYQAVQHEQERKTNETNLVQMGQRNRADSGSRLRDITGQSFQNVSEHMREQIEPLVEAMFNPSDPPADPGAMSGLEDLMSDKDARWTLACLLTRQRAKSLELPPDCFASMSTVLVRALDSCSEQHDIKCGVVLLNMAQTFYTVSDNSKKVFLQ